MTEPPAPDPDQPQQPSAAPPPIPTGQDLLAAGRAKPPKPPAPEGALPSSPQSPADPERHSAPTRNPLTSTTAQPAATAPKNTSDPSPANTAAPDAPGTTPRRERRDATQDSDPDPGDATPPEPAEAAPPPVDIPTVPPTQSAARAQRTAAPEPNTGSAAGAALWDAIRQRAGDQTAAGEPKTGAAKPRSRQNTPDAASAAGAGSTPQRPAAAGGGGAAAQGAAARKPGAGGAKNPKSKLLGGSQTKTRKTTEQRGSAKASGSATAKARVRRKALIALLPAAAAAAAALLLVLAMLGTETSTGSAASQPGSASDAAASRYLPTGWYQVLTGAANTTSARNPEAVVPWTVLAGLAKAQTDFGRYSPYDAADRDPGRTVPDIGTPGQTVTGPTSGAGPGPVSGVSGPGDATTLDAAHPAPPTGDLSHQLGWFLYALRMHESSGNYTARNADSGACGAYQYLTSTWNNYGGYPTACDAPPSVQDARKTADVLAAWAKYHNWQEITMSHYYPVWATTPAQWVNSPTGGKAGNPTGWVYVDDVMKKMTAAATAAPAVAGPAVTTGPVTSPPAATPLTLATTTLPALPAPVIPTGANGCPVADPSPAIGGVGDQGVGPFLLTAAAAADMRAHNQDPNSPCDAAKYVADKLSRTAAANNNAPGVPSWVPDGSASDMANARTRWSAFIARSGIFVDRSWTPGQPCALPPADPGHPQSTSYKITYIWHCQIVRSPALYLVTSAGYDSGGNFAYTVDPDRSDTEQRLVNEALDVSYGSGGWTAKCDNTKTDREGIFPMTKAEAATAGVTDRCDAQQNIGGAAKLVLSGEVQPPAQRAKTKGQYEPMIGGWENLSIAMGADTDQFSRVGPGAEFTSSPACDKVMTSFLTALGPQAGAFATLTGPPPTTDLAKWETQLSTLETSGHLTDPGTAPACAAGSWAPGFDDQLSQLATGLASPPAAPAPGSTPGPAVDPATAKNLAGLANYYLAEQNAIQPANPVAGTTTLVIPRLAPRPMNPISAPLDPDAVGAWNTLGTSSGVQTPLPTLAVEYAWFYGGVISPFNTAGQLIGSLQNASTTTGGDTGFVPAQTTVGPDGCPTAVPANTLRDGADKIGIAKICADAVAQAPTPEAALAVKWALTHLGWAYSQDKRMTDGYADCSSFVSRAYHDGAGLPVYKSWAPVTVGYIGVKWTKPVTIATSRPGDLMLPFPGHIAMQLTDGYKVETNATGDVSKVDRTYTSAWAVVRIIPAAVVPSDP